MENTTADVPWAAAGPFGFCLLPGAPGAAASWLESAEWQNSCRLIGEWAEGADPSDPFTSVVRVSMSGTISFDRAARVFASICDHKRSGFEEKRAMLSSWAEAVAGAGPSGDEESDLLLWRTAWAPTLAPDAPDGGIHEIDAAGLFRMLSGGAPHRLGMCDAFLSRLPSEFDPEASAFALSLLRDEMAVEGKVYDTYKGLFGAILEIMHWPAMSANARTRIESSLLGVACERRTSYTTSQAVSSMPETRQSFSG